MIQTTLGEILARRVKAHRLYCLYVISDEESYIYIGSSTKESGIINRIIYPNPIVKDFREFFLPDSSDWQVTLYTLEEAVEAYKDVKPFPLHPSRVTYYWSVLDAERWLIHYHKSFLNVNYLASRFAPIPKKYLSFPCDSPKYPKVLRERFTRNWEDIEGRRPIYEILMDLAERLRGEKENS